MAEQKASAGGDEESVEADESTVAAEAETGAGEGEDREKRKVLRVQRLFDAWYLSSALDSKAQHALKDVLANLQKAADVDEAAKQRLSKSAEEYWKRTSLLFGLLAERDVTSKEVGKA